MTKVAVSEKAKSFESPVHKDLFLKMYTDLSSALERNVDLMICAGLDSSTRGSSILSVLCIALETTKQALEMSDAQLFEFFRIVQDNYGKDVHD